VRALSAVASAQPHLLRTWTECVAALILRTSASMYEPCASVHACLWPVRKRSERASHQHQYCETDWSLPFRPPPVALAIGRPRDPRLLSGFGAQTQIKPLDQVEPTLGQDPRPFAPAAREAEIAKRRVDKDAEPNLVAFESDQVKIVSPSTRHIADMETNATIVCSDVPSVPA